MPLPSTFITDVQLMKVADNSKREVLGRKQWGRRFESDHLTRTDLVLEASESTDAMSPVDFFWIECSKPVLLQVRETAGLSQAITCNGFMVLYGAIDEIFVSNTGTEPVTVSLIFA